MLQQGYGHHQSIPSIRSKGTYSFPNSRTADVMKAAVEIFKQKNKVHVLPP